MSADTLTLPRAVVQIVFDTAVGSLNFASGMLDDEEVVALRAVAVALGVDPMLATTHEFACKYRGSCERRVPQTNYSPDALYCPDCKTWTDATTGAVIAAPTWIDPR